ARFLGQDAVARVSGEQRLDDGLLGGLVHLGDEVVRRLRVDLQQVEVERGPVDDRPCRARRLDGDVEHGMKRLRHGATWEKWTGGEKERATGVAPSRGARWRAPLRIIAILPGALSSPWIRPASFC